MRFNPEFLNRPRKKNNPETHLVRQCIIYLRAKGFQTGKIKTHGVYDKVAKAYRADPLAWVGVPDILLFMPGLAFIECKVTSGQSPTQKQFQANCIAANIPYYIIHSIEKLEEMFG